VSEPQVQPLPARAPARVLACGAFLKNRAGLLDGDAFRWSPLHDDLSTPTACLALRESLRTLVASASGPIDAVAHDLHPDFDSTRQALHWAQHLGVPAIAVQHHHAHAAVVQAEQGCTGDEAWVALALDGVGLGTDGDAWGGEVLAVRGACWQRVAHLGALALPGGDVAAREPWRLAAAVLHAAGRGDEIEPRLAPGVGAPLARGVRQMLARDLHCPRSTGARFHLALADALAQPPCRPRARPARRARRSAAAASTPARPSARRRAAGAGLAVHRPAAGCGDAGLQAWAAALQMADVGLPATIAEA
jgi:hydrogenase maturation protein HypF